MIRTAGSLLVVAGLALAGPALGQQSGWHYSPLPGEGDRASMGCTYGATAKRFTCLVVRCEDDFSVGLHLHTSKPGGDAGRWTLTFDKGELAFPVTAERDASPYGARVAGDVGPILQAIKDSGVVFLDPADGGDLDRAISLSGSLYAVNQALYFCAPKTVPDDQATRNPPSTGNTAPVM